MMCGRRRGLWKLPVTFDDVELQELARELEKHQLYTDATRRMYAATCEAAMGRTGPDALFSGNGVCCNQAARLMQDIA